MLRFGTVGTSAIMRLMQHAMAQVDGVECRAVYSRDFARGREFADSVGVAAVCADYNKLLAQEDIDAVYIASPNRFHAEQACLAMRAGKHVIVEKPAAVTGAEVRRMIDTARENGVFFFEAITTLFMPKYLQCRALLPQLGTLRSAELCYAQYSSKYDAYLRGENPNIFNPAMRAGALNDMGVYCVHMAVDLFGMPEGVRYAPELGENGIDLAGELTLRYPNLTVRIVTAKNANLGSGCRVEGERGFFAEDGPMNDFGVCSAALDGMEIKIDAAHAENRMVYELERFRDAIEARDEAFFARMARQSLMVAEILERAHGSEK
ncbi:MAG: Gfo/Idh/MocA family oxidoreductase [Firmicutes bacterium]|nr:Gfo/Idh/MocA family oxidoreductase [Bacillota bacterium]